MAFSDENKISKKNLEAGYVISSGLFPASGVNEDFIRYLIWQHHQQQDHQKSNINQQQQSTKQFPSEGVSKLKES